MRLADSTGLFGSEGENSADGSCSYCGKSWEPPDIPCDCENIDDCECELNDDDYKYFDTIGKLTICCDCYELFEKAILQRIKEILPWFTDILKLKLDEIREYNNLLQQVPIDIKIEDKGRFQKLEI